ncbi:hypothetical protein F4678DRAFT_446080 [Xylaria arbuscula]|nr:hypothetical protein F4678DRAFT_446080 [Xylaria arbuscula]
MEANNPPQQGGNARRGGNVQMDRPVAINCLQVLGRLVVLRLLFLCYDVFPSFDYIYQFPGFSGALSQLGVPVEKIPPTLSQAGSWSLFVMTIDVALQFVNELSTRLATSIDMAWNPSDNPPSRSLSLLTCIGRFLYPIWLHMDHAVLIYLFIGFLSYLLPREWAMFQYSREQIWANDRCLYYMYIPFVLYIALWIIYGVVATLWHSMLWRILRVVFIHIVFRGLAQLIMLLGYPANSMNIQIPVPYIARVTKDIFGQPIKYTTIRHRLVHVSEIQPQDIPQWFYAVATFGKTAYMLVSGLF